MKKEVKQNSNFNKDRHQPRVAGAHPGAQPRGGDEANYYCTYKPERDGLSLERIFGPVKDFRMPLRQVQASAIKESCATAVVWRSPKRR